MNFLTPTDWSEVGSVSFPALCTWQRQIIKSQVLIAISCVVDFRLYKESKLPQNVVFIQELKQEELLAEIEQFHSDASTQLTLVAASMVGPSAETVICSSMLLRSDESVS